MGDNMKKIIMVLTTLLVTVSCSSVQAEPLQADVKAFQDNAEDCQHFAGEWDSSLSKSRKKEIEAGVDKYCTQAREQQKQLKKKYRGNKQVEDIIADYDL
jgi:peptidoglycan hydrolase CwlO-like protein